jgi:hypothetical protein
MSFTCKGSELVEGGQSFAEDEVPLWHGIGERVKSRTAISYPYAVPPLQVARLWTCAWYNFSKTWQQDGAIKEHTHDPKTHACLPARAFA